MGARRDIGLLFLHALPLDGTMWDGQRDLLPGASHTPALYRRGEGVQDWAASALGEATQERLVVVGCSVGGSCALEVAAAAPDRVAALVLIGTKAQRAPDPALRQHALDTLARHGMEAAWDQFWSPLFSNGAARETARQTFLRQAPDDIARGIRAFHARPSRHRILERIPGPVVVISGAEDTAPGPRTSAIQAAAAPRGHLEIIPACGHYVPLEQPEALNAILRRLLSMLWAQA
ncbi:alpha/beta fold hydrolase [Xanthobacter pseudotagetidis]|uniref:alpha/beta fold hydrolase n=1 Tax=Xanthobacter pseudotagetidis TaxID=3119911 RepID=UPI00372BFEDF